MNNATYVDGFVAAVPTANRETYRAHADVAAEVFKEKGDWCAEHGYLAKAPGGEWRTLVDLDLTWRARVAERPMTLFVRGGNLLDEDARRHASPLKDFAPLPGRSLGLGVRFDF